MRQRASVLIWVLVLIALAGTVTTNIIAEHQRLYHTQQQLAKQQQAREWALGAAALSRGATLDIEGWSLLHDDDGNLQANNAEGHGWRIERINGAHSAEYSLPGPETQEQR